MSILIGGAGSSGTSLLSNKLNIHPDLFSTGEINFFNKEQLFENWSKNKLKILRKWPFESTKGWFVYRQSNLGIKECGWKSEEIKEMLKSSATINEFCESYFKKPLEDKEAKYWIEKTPSNCYSFNHFLSQFENGKVIHMVRNPLDVMASFCKRGLSPYAAAATWIYNNSTSLAVENSTRYLRISYEDLVDDPKMIFDKILSFLNVKLLDLNMEQTTSSMSKIGSWNSNPMHSIDKKSIGGFQRKDHFRRTMLGYHTGGSYYPIELINEN